MENEHNELFDDAILYYPFLTDNLVEWHLYKDDGFSLVFSYSDGHKTFYDSVLKGIRYFSPDNTSDSYIDEDRWRREVGFNIYRAMLKYSVTQAELSDKSGISQGTISKYTDGIVTPNAYKLTRIADALECDISELIFIRRVDTI